MRVSSSRRDLFVTLSTPDLFPSYQNIDVINCSRILKSDIEIVEVN
jgi:hypothetical protein